MIDLAALERALAADDLDAALGEAGRLHALLQAAVLTRRLTPPTATPGVVPYVTQEEAAAQLGVPLGYVRKLTRTDRAPSLRRGKRRLVRVAELAAVIDAQRANPLAGTVLRRVTSRHDR